MVTPSGDGEGAAAADVEDVVANEQPVDGTGLESNVAGALSYLLGVITGIVFFVVEPDDEFVRFHAAQSIAVFGVVFVASVVLSVVGTMLSLAFFTGGGPLAIVGALISLLLGLVWLVVVFASLGLWLYLMLTAYQGRTVRVPVAAGIADKLV